MAEKTSEMNQDWRAFGGSFSEWLIQFRDPVWLWKTHSSYVAYEYYFYFCALATLFFSVREGGRTPFIWLCAIIHGLWLEMLCYYIPDIDNFWQSHSSIMLFGHRYPVHIIALYAYFIPMGNALARRLHLKPWAEPFAAGLFVVLIDYPMDILGIKLLWWTWHDTDPAIFDRFYWVPWTSFIFHATFTASNWCLFNGFHKIIVPGKPRTHYAGIVRELLIAGLAGIFTFPMGVICFLVVYHPLHDFGGIHSEIICVVLLCFYLMMVFKSIRRQEVVKKENNWFDAVALLAFMNSIFYMIVVVLADPVNIQTTGYFETIGPCNATFTVQTPTGELTRAKYLCPTNYRSREYFDWHCLPEQEQQAIGAIGDGVGQPISWYTICGTPYPNRVEYITIVWAGCILGAILFYEVLSRSSSLYGGMRTSVHSKEKKGKKE